MEMFLNREEAGIRLSLILSRNQNLRDSIVISILRGGVLIGDVISKAHNLPHFALLVKKIGAPHNPELAIGATGSDGTVFWDEKLIKRLKIGEEERQEQLDKALKTIHERNKALGIKIPEVKGAVSIVVDDGVATGSTAMAACLILKSLGSKKVILATPVLSAGTKKELGKHYDDVVSVLTPKDFKAVGQFYKNFPQVSDNEVKRVLNLP